MSCLHPENTAAVSYNKGCRCERCSKGKREAVYRSLAKRRDAYNARAREWYQENLEHAREKSRRNVAAFRQRQRDKRSATNNQGDPS